MIEAPETARPMLVTMPLPVNTYDIDFTGAVSNIAYSRWLEDLRCQLIQDCFPLARMLELGFAPLLHSTQIKYRHSIHLFDEPIGRMWVTGVSEVQMSVQAEIHVAGDLKAIAGQKCAFIKLSKMKPVRVPGELTLAFAQACQIALTPMRESTPATHV